MPVKINWGKKVVAEKDLFFSHLAVGETFRIATPQSRGAVYMKIEDHGECATFQTFMLELATGKVFDATDSRIERVNVEINVDAAKPSCY